jgi:hypothetical protein
MIDLEAKCYSPGTFGTEVNTLAFERFRAWSRVLARARIHAAVNWMTIWL